MNEAPFTESLSRFVIDNRWSEIEKFFNESAFAMHLGINVDLSDPANPRCEINTIEPFHLGGVGQDYVNGAVISGMFDLIIGLTGITYTPLGNMATSNVNIRLLRPVDKKGFHLTGTVSRKIGNRVFSEATLFNSSGEPCAFANGEIRVGLK